MDWALCAMQARKAQGPQGIRPEIGGHAFSKPNSSANGVAPTTAVRDPSMDKLYPTVARKLNIVKALSVNIKDTYRKTDPSRPEAVDAAPRRVLTQPSFPVSNG